MKIIALITFLLTPYLFACDSEPVIIDVEKAKTQIKATGQMVIFINSKPIIFPVIDEIQFLPAKGFSASNHRYEVKSKVELAREFKFEINTDKKIKVFLRLEPLNQGGCVSQQGVEYK